MHACAVSEPPGPADVRVPQAETDAAKKRPAGASTAGSARSQQVRALRTCSALQATRPSSPSSQPSIASSRRLSSCPCIA